jgi:hypothetical protein
MSRYLQITTAISGLLAAGLCAAAPAPARAASVVYVISGITDNGGAAATGIATSLHCTNLGAANAVTVSVHNSLGAVIGEDSRTMARRNTETWNTHQPMLFAGVALDTGGVFQGYAVISASNANIACSAMIIDASTVVPNGIALHMQRRTPLANTQE